MKTEKKSKITRAFLISLAALILCSIVNWGFISDWGKVDVTRVTLVGDNDMKYSAVMYVPKTATNEHPAPGILLIHGGSGNARNHESQAIEFARRGFVAVSVDNQGSGQSEYSKAINSTAVPEQFLQYMLDMDIVDHDNIAALGHSAGGGPIYYLGATYGLKTLVASDCSAGQADLATNPNASEVTESADFHGNLIYINGSEDFLNPREKHLVTATGVWQRDGVDMQGDEQVEIGKLYGSFEEGNAHQFVEIPGQIHELAFLNRHHNQVAIDFVLESFGMAGTVPSGDKQIWQWSNVTGALGMAAFGVFMCFLVCFLIEKIPFFNTLSQPMPRNIGLRGKGLALSIIAAIGFPLLCLYTGSLGIAKYFFHNTSGNALFQVQYSTMALSFVIGLNLFGLVMLGVFWFTDAKKHHATIRDLGLTTEGSKGIDFKAIGKSILLAALVLFISMSYLEIQENVLGTEFYCMVFGVRPVALYKLPYYIPYIVVWVICFCVAAISINVERRLPSTGNEKADTAIAVVFNCVCATATITVMIFVQYFMQVHVVHSAARAVDWAGQINRLWGVPAGMLLGISGNTICYRKTGNIWLGAILFGTLAAIMACSYGTITFP